MPSQSLYDFFAASFLQTLSIAPIKSKTELYNPYSYLFKFSNVLISGEDGQLSIGVRVENLPGYWDTSFEIPIRKSKTVFVPTLKLGSGGNNGRITIPSGDPNYDPTGGNLTPGSRIDFLSAGDTRSQPNVSIEEYYGLNLYGTQATADQDTAEGTPSDKGDYSTTGQPVRVKSADLLITEGRLGIGNVPTGDLSGNFSSATEMLHVKGDALISGTLSVNGQNVVGGATGSMANYLSSSDSDDDCPKGWLPCNGMSLMKDHMLKGGAADFADPTQEPDAQYLKLFLHLAKNIGNNSFDFDTNTQIKKKGNHFHFFNETTNTFSPKPACEYDLKLPTIESRPASQGEFLVGGVSQPITLSMKSMIKC